MTSAPRARRVSMIRMYVSGSPSSSSSMTSLSVRGLPMSDLQTVAQVGHAGHRVTVATDEGLELLREGALLRRVLRVALLRLRIARRHEQGVDPLVQAVESIVEHDGRLLELLDALHEAD